MRGRKAVGVGVIGAVLLATCLFLILSLKKTPLDQFLGDDERTAIVAFSSELFQQSAPTADMAVMRNADENPYAINVFLEQEVEEWKIRRTLEMVRDAGFHWIKQQVPWADIEITGKGLYGDPKNNVSNTWLKYDRIVNLAHEYGLEVIMRLDTSPAWARPMTDKEETPPADLNNYGDFVSSVVSRYRGKVRHFQIWNEPNWTFEWGGRPPSAKDYVALLRVGYSRAKEANSDAVVLAAALAPTIEMSDIAVDDTVFLQQMYDDGAAQWFDVMSANPYGLRSGPDDRRLDVETDVNFSRPILTREIMVRNGDASKPIWAAELGWNALPPDFPGEAPWGRVSREVQARYSLRAYQRMQEEWPWMGVAALWHFRMVHDVNRDQARYYFGIVQNDFTPFPAYDSLKALATSEPVLYPGFHQESHWALDFDSNWQPVNDERASLGNVRVSAGAGAALSFTFQGNDLDLVVKRDADAGRLAVAIDGGAYAANRLPLDAQGRAYVDLQAAAQQWQYRVAVARGLPWTLHRVEVTTIADPDGHQGAAVDAVVVEGKRPNHPREISAISFSLLLLALVMLGPYRWLRNRQ